MRLNASYSNIRCHLALQPHGHGHCSGHLEPPHSGTLPEHLKIDADFILSPTGVSRILFGVLNGFCLLFIDS